MRNVLKVVIFCAQDELDPLGWCIWEQQGDKSQRSLHFQIFQITLVILQKLSPA